ncbi:MAG: OmpA family protein [Acidobacteriia bacterium]|nr:OmpA family protein [Terriglobia bacterium]
MFCQKCGAKADEGARFCLKCGNALGAAAAGSGAAKAAAPAAPASSSGGAAAGGKKSGCGPALMIGLGVFALLAIVVVAGVVYVGYRAKKKVDEVQSALKTKDIDKVARVLGGKEKQGGDAEKSEKPFPEFKEWSPSSAGAAAVAGAGSSGGTAKGAGSDWGGGGPVPLRKGLTVITAIAQEGGDYQSIKQIQDMTSDSVTMEYSADNVPERPNPFGGAEKNGGKKASKQSTSARRRILREDLQNAREYQEMFSAQAPLTMPGSTAIGVSAAVLNELKNKGETTFTYQRTGLLGGLGGMLSGISAMTKGMGGSAQDKEGMEKAQKDMEKLSKTECTMKRVGDKDSAFPVLLDDQSVELPAVRAKCTSDDSPDADFYILDNPDNPLALAWQIGEEDRLQVVSIRYENSDAGKQMEQQLEKKEKVKIYGIYFDFASAKIRPQSKPTLDEIAGVMKAHPDWVLRVDGHTDNVGGNAFNQTLSEERAAAVKKALVDGYHIPASHLTTGGFGASSPADTNDTMEGRAKNRRVELSRE